MSAFELRPYQKDLIARTGVALAKHRRVVMQMPTGGGKTACAADIIARYLSRKDTNRVVFMAHLDTLVSDTYRRLADAGIDAGYVQAGRPTNPTARAQVCSIQTLHSRSKNKKCNHEECAKDVERAAECLALRMAETLPPATLLIIDECHRAASASIRALLTRYENSLILGLTATPQRGDGQPLRGVFKHMEIGPSVQTLTDDGFLVPCAIFASGVEFKSNQIAEDPVVAYAKIAPNTRAIVFAPTKKRARELTTQFNAAGFTAECIVGETPRKVREGLRARIDSGLTKVLVGVDVFREGFDCPSIETVVLAKKINVLGGWLQSIGRGLRPSPATKKEVCTVIDLFGSVESLKHPATPIKWSLDGKPVLSGVSNRTCPQCMAIFMGGQSACPRCGFEIPVVERPARPVEVMHVELKAIKAPPPEGEHQKNYIRSIAKNMGLEAAIRLFRQRNEQAADPKVIAELRQEAREASLAAAARVAQARRSA